MEMFSKCSAGGQIKMLEELTKTSPPNEINQCQDLLLSTSAAEFPSSSCVVAFSSAPGTSTKNIRCAQPQSSDCWRLFHGHPC